MVSARLANVATPLTAATGVVLVAMNAPPAGRWRSSGSRCR